MADQLAWWVIAATQYGKPPQYNYFHGTKAQAQALASKTIEVSTQLAITGPFPTKAAAQASVKAGKANTPGIPGGYAQGTPGGASPACALNFPGVAGVGQFCIISKTALRAAAGAGVLLVAAGVGLVAVILLGQYALKETGAGRAAMQAAKYVPFIPV